MPIEEFHRENRDGGRLIAVKGVTATLNRAKAEDDGLKIALTPVQLAAALTDGGTIYETESTANRFYGGLRSVFGLLELATGVGLLLAPEPTMATKIGGAALSGHAVDSVQTGVRQVWTGRSTNSLTEDATAALARQLGADKDTAANIGTAVDIAVPVIVTLGVGAARAVAVRGGRIVLSAHEAAAGSRVGGHTIAKHVGKTEAELNARLVAEVRIPAATTFKTLEAAEKVLYQALRANKAQIETWAKTARAGARLVLDYKAGTEIVGHGVIRATGQLTEMTAVRLVLKMEKYNGIPYYILTSYPIP